MFHHVDQPELLCFSIRTGRDTVQVVMNADPHRPRRATVWLDIGALGVEPGSPFMVTDEMTGDSYRCGRANYIRLAPPRSPARIFAVTLGTP